MTGVRIKLRSETLDPSGVAILFGIVLDARHWRLVRQCFARHGYEHFGRGEYRTASVQLGRSMVGHVLAHAFTDCRVHQ